MNKVILMGRLTRDPDMRYTQGENGMAIARFSLAVDRRRANQDGQRDADFINCVSFGRTAEFAERYLHQGTKIVLTGRIQTGSYTNKEGQKVYTTEVIGEDLEFAESKAASERSSSRRAAGSDEGYQSNNSYHNQEYQPVADQSKQDTLANDSMSGEGFMNIPEGIEDEGLPFN